MLRSFSPRQAPLKEGRSHPGLPYGGPSARRINPRQGIVIIMVLLCFPLALFFIYGGGAISAAAPPPELHGNGPAPPGVLNDGKVVLGGNHDSGFIPNPNGNAPFKAPTEAVPATPKIPDEPLGQKPIYHAEETSAQAAAPKNYGGSSNTAPGTGAVDYAGNAVTNGRVGKPGKFTWAERPNFEKALAKVVNMLPGEMQSRDLLREVGGTGREKLREMGLRTRAYKTYFDAWENLHLGTDEEGGTYVRDDVIQYLRSHEHKGPIPGLEEMALGQTIRAYESYRAFLAKFSQLLFPWTAPYFSDHMDLHAHFRQGGRGIVLTAGDDQAPYLLTTIPMFRHVGCNLPIEVMYLGDSDLSEDFRAELEALDGVVTRDIAQMVNDEGWRLAGWAAKPFAMLFSSFREVIFIDADSLFFKNPELLFDDPDYQRTGALFFKDRLIMPESRKRFLQQILPKPISKQVKQSRFWTGDSGHMQESGCVVVDKWRHFIALLMVTRMNGPDRDGNKDEGRVGVYDMVYGDKETFWIGWELVGDQDYAFHKGDAGIMGTPEDPREHKKQREAKKKAEEKEKHEDEDKDHEHDHERDEHKDSEHPDGNPENPLDSLELHEEPPQNWTICAPQLLHLDNEGKPLWFNGWLLANKFADKREKKFGNFQSYLAEPREVRDPGQWQLEESNSCCLTSDADQKFDFSPEEKALLQMMMDKAKEVGAPGSH